MPCHANSGSFQKGKPKPGPGRPRKTPEQKATEKLQLAYARQNAASFIEACEKLLPRALNKLDKLIDSNCGWRAMAAHIRIVEVLSDRIYGRPAQAITGAHGGPLVVSFVQIIDRIDGGAVERFEEPPQLTG